MKTDELIELCQWDFVSYKDASSISPTGRGVIPYQKIRLPLGSYNPDALPSLIQTDNFEIRIRPEPFGFYSWMPTSPEDRAVVLEHKVRPKPWTSHKPKNEERTNFVCSTIETLIDARSFLAGVSCVSERHDAEQFLIMFAVNSVNSVPIYLKCFIELEELFMRYQSKEQIVGCLDSVVDEILWERQCAFKPDR